MGFAPLCLLFLVLTLSPFYTASANDFTEASALIAQLQNLPSDFATRIDFTTQYFLGRPYLKGGPLGEGENARYDEDPLFRMDGFDCTTFVETNLALAKARDFNDFLQSLSELRYAHATISFQTRNHFVELDWNPNNILAGFVSDITSRLGVVNLVAKKTFSKKRWYRHLPLSELNLPGADAQTLARRLFELHHLGDADADEASELPYIQKNELLVSSEQLPAVSIFNILKGNQVSHQVLVLKINGQIRVRQASSKASVLKVTDSSLEEYVKTLSASPTSQGANILEVLAP